MKRLRLAIIGFGRVGRACAEAILASDDLTLSGIVRRAESLAQSLPDPFRAIPVVSHVGELQGVEGALICVPAELVRGMAHDLLQRRIPIVECAILHGEAFHAHKEEIHRVAFHRTVPAVIGAGWDPGALSHLRSLFALLTPQGHTQTTHRPGVDLHHIMTVQKIPGLKEALCTERRTTEGKVQRYVYVELEKGADPDRVMEAIRTDPLFLKEETHVFPVESVVTLEEEGHGVVLERWGASGRTGHQHFMMEARFDATAVTAQVMVAAAKALPKLGPGAHSLLDVPFSLLWGDRRDKAEREWM